MLSIFWIKIVHNLKFYRVEKKIIRFLKISFLLNVLEHIIHGASKFKLFYGGMRGFTTKFIFLGG